MLIHWMCSVLSTLSRSLLKRDYYVLKFNSRGVGQSGGWSSLTGMSESKDLESLVLWALNNIEDVADVVFIVSMLSTAPICSYAHCKFCHRDIRMEP